MTTKAKHRRIPHSCRNVGRSLARDMPDTFSLSTLRAASAFVRRAWRGRTPGEASTEPRRDEMHDEF